MLLLPVKKERGLGAFIPSCSAEKLGVKPAASGMLALLLLGVGGYGPLLLLVYVVDVPGVTPPLLSIPRVMAAECSGFSSSAGLYCCVGLVSAEY